MHIFRNVFTQISTDKHNLAREILILKMFSLITLSSTQRLRKTKIGTALLFRIKTKDEWKSNTHNNKQFCDEYHGTIITIKRNNFF